MDEIISQLDLSGVYIPIAQYIVKKIPLHAYTSYGYLSHRYFGTGKASRAEKYSSATWLENTPKVSESTLDLLGLLPH